MRGTSESNVVTRYACFPFRRTWSGASALRRDSARTAGVSVWWGLARSALSRAALRPVLSEREMEGRRWKRLAGAQERQTKAQTASVGRSACRWSMMKSQSSLGSVAGEINMGTQEKIRRVYTY
jgi:hypothetical protein